MARCRTCGKDSIGKRICPSCLREWTDMRTTVFDKLMEVHGHMTPDNHHIFKKEMKRIENIWKKDKEKYQKELEKI